jgi:sugar phosphate isomerase/epimerase
MKTRLACQLYSVHDSIDVNAFSAVREAAKLGFKGLEFYGTGLWDLAFVKAALNDTGLEIAGWHVPVDRLKDDELEKTLDFHSEIGNRAIVVPWLPVEMRDTADAWKRTADLFNRLHDRLSERGMSLGYHNHDFEFKPLDESKACGWDIFSERTHPDIVLQLDNGNCMAGGANPVQVMKQHPGRGRTLHLKPYSHAAGYDCMVGQDDLPWAAFFQEAERQGATEWYIAEYESRALASDLMGLKIMREAFREYGL